MYGLVCMCVYAENAIFEKSQVIEIERAKKKHGVGDSEKMILTRSNALETRKKKTRCGGNLSV